MMKMLMAMMMRLMSPCADATRLASESLDRPLTGRERRALRLHLLMCHLCRRYARQLRALHHVLHRHPETYSHPRTGLSPVARERIKRALQS
jgi:hypothetical protein